MISKRKCIRIVNGVFLIRKILERFQRDIYQYNSMISTTGYYLKPVHIVTKEVRGEKRKYYYYGRYWWKIEYSGKKGKTSKVSWKYVGREKPAALKNYPDPPRNPFEGLRFVVKGQDIIVEEQLFEKFKEIFKNVRVEECED